MEYKEIEINNLIYLVSSNGEVYRKLKPYEVKDGYQAVKLGGKTNKKTYLHRLVAECFISNPNNLSIINHKDENPSNNCVDNLEWCTVQYNNSYGTKPQRTAITKSKPVVQCDKQTRKPIDYFINAKKASQQFPVPENARKRICEVCNDPEGVRFHSAYGYWWRYATEEEIKTYKIKEAS